MEINWEGLRTPNIYGAFTEGMDQARQEKRQKTYDAYQQERIANERADRETALADRNRAEQGRAAAVDALGKNDIPGARKAAITAGDPKLLDYLTKLDDQSRTELKQRNQVQATALNSLRGPDGKLLPDAGPRWANMKQRFLESGWKPEELNFDPLQPGVIDAEIAEATTLEESLRLAETARNHREMESIARDRAESYDYSAHRPRATGRGGGGGAAAQPVGGPLAIDPSQVRRR